MYPPSSPSPESLRGGAEVAAYAGLVPFVICPVAIAVLSSYELRLLAQQVALAYGAALLASAGAVHWGLALAGRIAFGPLRIAGAVLPGVCAAGSLLLGGQHGLALLVVGFGVFWLYEHRSVGQELPADYLRLRRNLTLAGCCLLAVTMIVSGPAGLL